jgi:hypothetical protein
MNFVFVPNHLYKANYLIEEPRLKCDKYKFIKIDENTNVNRTDYKYVVVSKFISFYIDHHGIKKDSYCSEGLREIELNNGLFVAPVKIFSHYKDANEGNSFEKSSYLIGIRNKEGDVDTLITSENDYEGTKNKCGKQGWYYENTYTNYSVVQKGVRKIIDRELGFLLQKEELNIKGDYVYKLFLRPNPYNYGDHPLIEIGSIEGV